MSVIQGSRCLTRLQGEHVIYDHIYVSYSMQQLKPSLHRQAHTLLQLINILDLFCGCCSDYSTSRQNSNYTADIVSSANHKKLITDKEYAIGLVSNKHCLVHND
jgi:hypothetical protein